MKENKKNVFEALEENIMKSNMSEEEKTNLLKNIMDMREQRLNIMIVGATGCGKSSTINALFGADFAKVGTTPDPETMDIQRYEKDNLILWDTPGLGDGKEADNRHAKNIIKMLAEKDDDGNAVIDLVLVILDGSTRDLGTSYELINSVIIPNMGEEQKKRILVAINQADMAMKGRNWDFEKNEPNEVLQKFLEEKVDSVKRRIMEATGVKVDPIYYSAGYKEDGMEQKPYNLTKLLCWMIKATPEEKRVVYVSNINPDEGELGNDDNGIDYKKEIRGDLFDSIAQGATVGGEIGESIGTIIGGPVGGKIGKAAGIVLGGIVAVIGSIFSF